MKIYNPVKRSGWLVRMLLFCSVPLLGIPAVSDAAADSQPKDLRMFYQQNCAGCHGADGAARDTAGKSLRGQDFTDVKWLKETSDEKMAKVILKGLFFGFAMPAYNASLAKEEAVRMVTEIIRKCEKDKIIQPLAKAAGPAR